MVPQGLSLNLNFITQEKETEIISWLDNRPWSSELSRRTQHYGYNYNYKSGNLIPTDPLQGPLLELAQRIESAGLMKPVQCIVNEYYRNQGISPHIDNLSFGPTIIGVSIGADSVINFTHGHDTFNCFLPQRSVMMMTGPSRYQWKHSIPKCLTYTTPEGTKIKKPDSYRRISLTYRELSS